MGCRNKTAILPKACLLAMLACAAAVAQSQQPLGELLAPESGPRGPVPEPGTGIAVSSGSVLSAGQLPAALKLNRGGQVRICPQSKLTVTAAGNGAIMLATGTGAIEINYPIDAVADSVVTPDLRFMLAGPGTFHFALGVNGRGDTCVKPLTGNAASIIVLEVMGQSTYQVREDEAVLFSQGKVAERSQLTGECGCPQAIQAATDAQLADDQPPKSEVTGPLPAQRADQVKVQVETPFVFNARGQSPQPAAFPVAKITYSRMPEFLAMPTEISAVPPASPDRSAEGASSSGKEVHKKGFLGKIKGFFAHLFHKS